MNTVNLVQELDREFGRYSRSRQIVRCLDREFDRYFRGGEVDRYSESENGEHWITINGDSGNGTHIKLDGKGTIVAGPKALMDKRLSSLKRESEKSSPQPPKQETPKPQSAQWSPPPRPAYNSGSSGGGGYGKASSKQISYIEFLRSGTALSGKWMSSAWKPFASMRQRSGTVADFLSGLSMSEASHLINRLKEMTGK